MKRKRYRYIWCGLCPLDSPVSDYDLMAYVGRSAMRIEIPDDMELYKYRGDDCSNTEDERLIKDLNPHPVIRKNGRLVIRDDLLQYEPHEWYLYYDD